MDRQRIPVAFPAGVDLAAFADELRDALGLECGPPLHLDLAGPVPVVVVGAGDPDTDPVLDPVAVAAVAAVHVPPGPAPGSLERLVEDPSASAWSMTSRGGALLAVGA